MKRMLIFTLLLFFWGCDFYDEKLNVVNGYGDDVILGFGFIESNFSDNLILLKEKFDSNNNLPLTNQLNDTIKFGVLGSWENVMTNSDDSILIFVAERKKVIAFFVDSIDVSSVYETFVFSHKDIVDKKWIITVTPNSKRLKY